MAAGDVKLTYVASSNLTITALQVPIASSQTWVAGWQSIVQTNSSNYLDCRVTAKLKVAASNNQAGELRLYLVGALDDTPNYMDTFTGAEGTVTLTDTEMRDAICRLGAFSAVDNTASDIYYLDCPSVAAVFGGNLPKNWQIYITANPTTTTTGAFATSGSQVTIQYTYANVAQS